MSNDPTLSDSDAEADDGLSEGKHIMNRLLQVMDEFEAEEREAKVKEEADYAAFLAEPHTFTWRLRYAWKSLVRGVESVGEFLSVAAGVAPDKEGPDSENEVSLLFRFNCIFCIVFCVSMHILTNQLLSFPRLPGRIKGIRGFETSRRRLIINVLFGF